jgi:hypothetical protein
MTITFGVNKSEIKIFILVIFHGQPMLQSRKPQLMYFHLIILNMEFACSLF